MLPRRPRIRQSRTDALSAACGDRRLEGVQNESHATYRTHVELDLTIQVQAISAFRSRLWHKSAERYPPNQPDIVGESQSRRGEGEFASGRSPCATEWAADGGWGPRMVLGIGPSLRPRGSIWPVPVPRWRGCRRDYGSPAFVNLSRTVRASPGSRPMERAASCCARSAVSSGLARRTSSTSARASSIRPTAA